MAIILETATMPPPVAPRREQDYRDLTTLRKYITKQDDYIKAMQRDLVKLVTVVNTQHP